MKKLIIALSLCLVVLLGICVALNVLESRTQSGGNQTESTNPQAVTYEVKFICADGECAVQTVEEGKLPTQVSAEVDGLRFGGWTDEAGNFVDPFSTAVTKDTVYNAVLYPQLTGHRVYLFTDESGCLRPDAVLTADELTQALNALADQAALAYFPELPVGDTEVTEGEAAQVLLHFFDKETVDGAFSADGAEGLTRTAFAQGMNALLGHEEAEKVSLAEGAAIPVDVNNAREDAAALLEASMEHVVAEEGTAWTELELPTAYEPGFVNIDGWLYYVQEDRYFLKDEYVGFLYFDGNGRYTCGDAELDATVAGLLDEMIDAAPDADRMTLLRTVYDYCHQTYTYRRTYDHPAFGAHGWEIERAKAMFETGKGNCYSYAAIFWALSRGLGYQTRAQSGTCLSDEQPHSWCIIEVDGADYFFDPEWQYAYTERGVFDKDMFKIPMDKISYWGYKWSE